LNLWAGERRRSLGERLPGPLVTRDPVAGQIGALEFRPLPPQAVQGEAASSQPPPKPWLELSSLALGRTSYPKIGIGRPRTQVVNECLCYRPIGDAKAKLWPVLGFRAAGEQWAIAVQVPFRAPHPNEMDHDSIVMSNAVASYLHFIERCPGQIQATGAIVPRKSSSS